MGKGRVMCDTHERFHPIPQRGYNRKECRVCGRQIGEQDVGCGYVV